MPRPSTSSTKALAIDHVVGLHDVMVSSLSEHEGSNDQTDVYVQIFLEFFDVLVDSYEMNFGSLYSLLSFAAETYGISSDVRRAIQVFRKYRVEDHDVEAMESLVVDSANFEVVVLAHLFAHFLDAKQMDAQILELSKQEIFVKHERHGQIYKRDIDFFCEGAHIETHCLAGYSPEISEDKLMVRLDEHQSHRDFEQQLKWIPHWGEKPIKLCLFDVHKKGDGDFTCAAFTILPDYLVDITAVAQCFGPFGNCDVGYFIQRLLPKRPSLPLLKGNIVNHLLDRLIDDPSLRFEDEVKSLFKEFALPLGNTSDDDLRQVLSDLKVQFENLRKVINDEIPKLGFESGSAILEPSFYNVRWGVQGRLDMYFNEQHNAGKTGVIELKSSKPFMPNSYGLSVSHYVQTLLYELMVSATLSISQRKSLSAFILYSAMGDKTLRYAPSVQSLKYEALAWRNRLVMGELCLAALDPAKDALSELSIDGVGLKGYLASDHKRLKAALSKLSGVEKAYYNSFLSFLTRELFVQKLGRWRHHKAEGQSALWLASSLSKEENHMLIRGLELMQESTHDLDDEVFLAFRRPQESKISAFRMGDAVVIYPYVEGRRPVDFPVTKVRLVQIDKQKIIVQLRTKPINKSLFVQYESWCLEPDFLDSSFRHLRHAMFEWAAASPEKRSLILGSRPPVREGENPLDGVEDDKEKQRICQAAVNCSDYYLIWGPPGTGKTSVVLREIVHRLLEDKKEKVLLLAYTNRAVDELCHMVESLEGDWKEQYVRVGSHLGSHASYRHALIQNRISNIEDRRSLRNYLSSRKLFVGTLAAIHSKREVFDYLSFDTLILDEASQVLEPQIIGLLTKVKRFILVGDHRQLPAVVVQPESGHSIDDEGLKSLDFDLLSNSLFERLFSRARDQNWTWAYGMLGHQGRMHKEISDFVSKHFYDKVLDILPDGMLPRQTAPLERQSKEPSAISNEALRNVRLVFLDPYNQTVKKSLSYQKKSDAEAQAVTEVVRDLLNLDVAQSSIGIITTFRAQIANINMELSKLNLPTDDIAVDTVERYQGGAKDVVIYSPVVRRKEQMAQIVHYNAEGQDRKFNVVLSRAREQVIVVGHEETLRTDKVYRAYIEAFA